MDEFTQSYIAAALAVTNDESDLQGGDYLDCNYSQEDIAPECLAKMIADCEAFQKVNLPMIESNLDGAGYDFWLTRNGHAAGFWDGDWLEHGDQLTAACEAFGEFNIYLGDDKRIYC